MNKTLQLSMPGGGRGFSLHLGASIIGGRMVAAVIGLLLITACATTPLTPSAEMQAAELAIANAERERVVDYASAELSQAREKLTAARSAVQEDKMERALRLAQQARLDAELASAKADVAKARAINDEMQKSINTLKKEMQRSTGVNP